MKHIVRIAFFAALATVAGAAMAGNMSLTHVQHVNKSWTDTPQQKGLMETAIGEAEIAALHAGFAAKKPDDLAWMKMHNKHVINALDPGMEPKGPGMGYGAMKASKGVIKHIKLAAGSKDASDYLKMHAVHVATSAENAVKRSQQVLKLSKKLQKTYSSEKAAKLSKEIVVLTQAILNGTDANGDGKITWQAGEGGLLESRKHLGFIVKHAGL
ncbi:MAG: hypothetical protein ACWGOV_12470 [Acidiferrobacterales bacterium]